MGRFINTPVKRYSSGMKLRLAFSVAAHLIADVMIIDEVLAVGDMQFQKKCLGKMSEIGKVGKTILFVSHRLNVLRNICPKSMLIIDGRIKDFGETEKIIEAYSNITFGSYQNLGNNFSLNNLVNRGNKNLQIIKFYSFLDGKDVFYDFFVKRNAAIDFFLDIKINKKCEGLTIRIGLRSPVSNDMLYLTNEHLIDLQNIKKDTFKLKFSIEPTFLVPNKYPLYIILASQKVGVHVIDDPILTLEILNDGKIKIPKSGSDLAYTTSNSICKIIG